MRTTTKGVGGITILAGALVAAAVAAPRSTAAEAGRPVETESFISLLTGTPKERQRALRQIGSRWQPGYAVMLLELLPFSREMEFRRRLVELLEEKTDQELGLSAHDWYEWLWSQPERSHPGYAEFKSQLYGHIDPRFRNYFDSDHPTTIRLDEVRWGGVQQDGIPPLHSPAMVEASEAGYLDDGDIVFGLEVEGDARAYPKRILAWHELFTDTVGGVAVAGVYCTLCGTVLVYRTTVDGTEHQLGTSGFLYRSNKLMYDRASQSLWSTIWGRPVIGPLVGRGLQLQREAVVTTTWAEWRRRHPETTVLSLETGYARDYSEGAAYRDYFATDELMFNVPELDRQLANKAEVLTLRLEEAEPQPLAIAADYLAAHPIHHDRLGDLEIVVLTDGSGANRVYLSEGRRFVEWDGDRNAIDADGVVWRLSESRLLAPDGRRLPRVPAQRAFWFGWYAAYPETRLVH